MRNILLFLSLTFFAYAQERFCIEVLKTQQKKAITKEFMQKVESMSMPHSLKYSKGTYRVLLGDFKTRNEAESILDEVKEKINKEAVVSVCEQKRKPIMLNPKAKMQQAMLMAQAKMIKPEEKEASQENNVSMMSVDIEAPQGEDVLVKKEEQPAESTVSKQVEEPKTVVKENRDEKLVCKPTKKALREAEIEEALSFYKNSSFYSFKK